MIDSTLEPGNLEYAELAIEGEEDREVLISTYVCHPSLANDNLSGIAVATMLAKRLLERRPRHSYRFLFAPGTIGPLAWLDRNRERLDRIEHGLAISCIGDDGGFTYKRSRRGDADVDRAMEVVLRDSGAPHRVLPWEPWGGDERQFCSPGFDLPVGTLMRTPHGEFDGYHTSADDLDRIRVESLTEAVETCERLIEVLETNRQPINLSPYGEPQLGRRGLYRSAGGRSPRPTTSARCSGCSTRATAARICSRSPSVQGSATGSCNTRRSGLSGQGWLRRARSPPTASPRDDAARGRARAGYRRERADRQSGAPPVV